MANHFCSSCGSKLLPDTRFCVTCGTPFVNEDVPIQIEAQDPLVVIKPQGDQQPIQRVEGVSVKGVENVVQTASAKIAQVSQLGSTLGNLLGEQIPAADSAGEIICVQTLSTPKREVTQALGPIKYVFSSGVRLLKGFSGAMKDKRKLISALVLVVIWVGYALLKYFKVEAGWINGLGIITFAQGGLGTGPLGTVGGIVGKGIVAFVFTQFMTALLSFKNPFAGLIKGVGTYFKSFASKNIKGFSPLLLGCGLALVAYNFMSGEASPTSIAVGVSGLVISMKALTQKTGFIKGLFRSFHSKRKKAKPLDLAGINRFIAGLSTGFATGMGLSLTRIGFICYFIGGFAIVVAIALLFVPSQKREAVYP